MTKTCFVCVTLGGGGFPSFPVSEKCRTMYWKQVFQLEGLLASPSSVTIYNFGFLFTFSLGDNGNQDEKRGGTTPVETYIAKKS